MFKQAYIGFMERMKLINAMRLLGTGMDLGGLSIYAHEIAFSLLLQIFHRQLSDNRARTKQDMIEIIHKIIEEMKIPLESQQQVLRLVDGVLWSNKAGQSPFECYIYNEKTKQHEIDKFRYLEEDLTNSSWEKEKSTVYRLTKRAEQMIFITREIIEELGFDLEQFYTLQLIKNGYYEEAISSTQNLIARVKRLIIKEEEYRRNLKRNPRVMITEQRAQRRKKKEEIQRQFDDEQKMFETMLQWKKHKTLENQRKNIDNLFEDIEKARHFHDILAKIVLDNIAYEIELRLKSPQRFWKLLTISFKKNYWDEEIVKKGLNSFDTLEEIVGGLFAIEVPFIFPLDWAWQEQITINPNVKKEVKEKYELKDIPKKEIPWKAVKKLWEPIFDILLEKERLDDYELENILSDDLWNENPLFIDIFMMFTLSETKLYIVDEITEETDIRIALYTKLCKEHEKFKVLNGKIIKAKILDYQKRLIGNTIKISPYTLYVN